MTKITVKMVWHAGRSVVLADVIAKRNRNAIDIVRYQTGCVQLHFLGWSLDEAISNPGVVNDQVLPQMKRNSPGHRKIGPATTRFLERIGIDFVKTVMKLMAGDGRKWLPVGDE